MKRYIKSKIYGQATSRKDLGDGLHSSSKPIVQELIKLWIYPNSQYVKHWRSEIRASLQEVDILKHSHKLPSKKFILENTWNEHKKRLFTQYENEVDKILLKESELEPDIDRLDNFEEFFDSAESYFIWLSENLSKEGIVKNSDIYKKLEELGF